MKKNLYLALTVIGFLASSYFVFIFYTSATISTWDALAQIPANGMGQLLVADLTISAIVAWVFIYQESKRLKMKNWWVYLLLTAGVGLCFALPLFLYMREKHLTS